MIFDRHKLRIRKDRMASKYNAELDFFLNAIMPDLMRIAFEIMENKCPSILVLGSHAGQIERFIRQEYKDIDAYIVQSNLSEKMLHLSSGDLVMDEEHIAFAKESFDIVVSIASLHWVNDLNSTMNQIYSILKPHSLFVGTLFGPDTLSELRRAAAVSENKVFPRISPFIDLKDAGTLLQRHNFRHIITKTNTISLHYSSPLKLIQDLHDMGESNSLFYKDSINTSPYLIARIIDNYYKMYALSDGTVPATIDNVTLLAKTAA